jgi:hypothetical protein
VGETAADTAREIEALRSETERLLDALEGRARRVLNVRDQVQAQVKSNPALVALVGAGAALLAVATVLAIWYRNYQRAKEARRPINRLRRGAEVIGTEARERARRAGEAIRGEPPYHDEEQAKQQESGMAQRLAGAVAASATLALVDQFTRWLAKRQAASSRRATQE